MNGLTKETFKSADQSTRDDLMFDCMISIDRRLKTIEGRKWLFTASSFAGGVVGGITMVASWAWLKANGG